VNSRQPALVLLSVLSVAACLAETSTGTRGRSSSVDAAGCHDKTRWSGARQSLERDLASGFLTPSASIDDGRLASQVATYMRARLIKDVDTLLDFMVASDAPTRQRQREFYGVALPSETFLDYQVLGAKGLDGTPATFQVFCVVAVRVDAQCHEDVLTTNWTKTAGGWRVLPMRGVEPVF